MLDEHKDQVIFIDYYKMIHKETAAGYIQEKLSGIGLQLVNTSNVLSVLQKPSKSHGKGVAPNSDMAFQRYSAVSDKIKQTMISDHPTMYSRISTEIMDWYDDTNTDG